MSLANPLGLASLADLLTSADVKFSPMWNQQMSLTGGGETLYADRAPMIWSAEITTSLKPHADCLAIMALLNSRAGGLKTFLLNDQRLPYPSSDPTGSIFGTATPIVGTITDRFHLAFTGFPNGYSIPLGTYFQIIFGSTRYYLGQFAEAKTASGAGAVTAVEVAPALPASIAGGEAVTVKKPAAKFRVDPNSASMGLNDMLNSTVTFTAKQTYAA